MGCHRYHRESAGGFFFAKYGQVGDVSPIISKTGIATGDCFFVFSGGNVTQKLSGHSQHIDLPGQKNAGDSGGPITSVLVM